VATALDLAVGTGLLSVGATTRVAAMTGTAIGTLFGYFANRFFAFRDHQDQGHHSAWRFILVTSTSTLIHGQLVVWMRDRFGIPFVLAKMASDMVVFNFGQLVVLRYLVFPKRPPDEPTVDAPAPTPTPTPREV
jgi:putative flippase GtrA